VKSVRISWNKKPATLSFFIDITEQKKAEEALLQANRQLNLMTSITRHDINNQITMLTGFLRILEKKHPDPALSEYFQKISTTTKRISAMIRFTKEYEKIGVRAPVWQDTHILVDTATKEVPLGNVKVKNDIPSGPEIFADPLIVKVFYNLMDNAARYGEKISTIRFSVQESGENYLIVCEDNGEGIPAEEKEKIFDRGFGKNTGLGLFFVREILSITGITIRESGELGKGARFEITVPKGAYRFAAAQ
jgi:signal transduction histidine kinase